MKVLKDLLISELKFIIEKEFNLEFHRFLLGEEKLKPLERKTLDKIIKEYKEGKPFEYILKKTSFFGLEFYIDERVFIPRPETEVLLQVFLEFVKEKENLLILDIGTGSANIPVVIGIKKPSFKIFSVDISFPALKLARRNILKHNLRNTYLINADLLSSFRERTFDVIISNPPYVESSYIEKNNPLKFEPRVALDGGKDGLNFIGRILSKGRLYLKKEGLLFLEIGYNQKDRVLKYALEEGLKLVSIRKDYSGIERVVVFMVRE